MFLYYESCCVFISSYTIQIPIIASRKCGSFVTVEDRSNFIFNCKGQRQSGQQQQRVTVMSVKAHMDLYFTLVSGRLIEETYPCRTQSEPWTPLTHGCTYRLMPLISYSVCWLVADRTVIARREVCAAAQLPNNLTNEPCFQRWLFHSTTLKSGILRQAPTYACCTICYHIPTKYQLLTSTVSRGADVRLYKNTLKVNVFVSYCCIGFFN
jgi:hypothetical protein